MADRVSALVLVEGGRLEPRFFSRLALELDMDIEIVAFECNIYQLYEQVKDDLDHFISIKEVAKEITPSEDSRAILDRKFAYTYLVLDCDIHDNTALGKVTTGNAPDLNLNLDILDKMVAFFCDETDDTIGKLYINYPMMESYRDCDCPFDSSYASRYSDVMRGSSYKQDVSSRKMNKNISKYGATDFVGLMRQNVFKANLLLFGEFSPMEYAKFSDGKLLEQIQYRQREMIIGKSQVAVLNTSLFLPLDYFGNQNGYYDKTVRNEI